MALRIGFSTQYYTLWDVNFQVTYDGQGRPYYNTYYMYIQNLSIDLDKATQKAIKKGCQDTEIDHELFGRNTYFETKKPMFTELTKHNAYYFCFGKYYDTGIIVNNDVKYLGWYFQQTRNLIVEKRISDLGYMFFGEELIQKSEFLDRVTMQQIAHDFETKTFETGKLTINDIQKNLDYNGNLFIKVPVAQYKENTVYSSFKIRFPQYKEMVYQDFMYALPMVGDKGKKIKGKNLKLNLLCLNRQFNEYEVTSFEIF